MKIIKNCVHFPIDIFDMVILTMRDMYIGCFLGWTGMRSYRMDRRLVWSIDGYVFDFIRNIIMGLQTFRCVYHCCDQTLNFKCYSNNQWKKRRVFYLLVNLFTVLPDSLIFWHNTIACLTPSAQPITVIRFAFTLATTFTTNPVTSSMDIGNLK